MAIAEAGRPARGVSQVEGRSWRRVAGLLFAAVALGFLTLFVWRNVGELRAHEWSIRPWLLALSILVNITGFAWGVGVWRLVLRRMGTHIRYLALARVWFVSSLARYIPGKIWQFVGAAHLGQSSGLTPTVTVTSLATHTLFFTVGAILIAIYLLPASIGGVGGVALDVLRWCGLLLLLLGHPAVMRAGLGLIRRVTGRDLASWGGSWLDGIRIVVFSGFSWALTGFALYLFIIALTPLPSSAAGAVIGMNALSFVAGYLVFVAPAGLGAKELSLTALLTLYLPAEVAALIAVASRLWSIVAEVVPALLLIPRRGAGATRLVENEAPVPPPST